MNLKKYLEEIKKLDLSKCTNVYLVVGNESADLDSVVTPFVYAFYLSTKAPDSCFLPLIWCDKDDIVLRTEVVALFKRYSLPLDCLLYKDDWPALKQKVYGKNIEVTLVDHNHGREHEDLNHFVTNIIDHHEDSNDFADVPKQIKFVGSCATLIAEQIKIASNTFFESFPDACEMLLATILIDTYNLDLHSGRTTEQDVFTAEILSRLTDADTDQLFITIQTAKTDFASMTTYNILRKDYKPVPKVDESSPNLGISSVTLDGNVLIAREDFNDTAADFMQKNGLDLLVVMFVCFQTAKDSQPQKNILVLSTKDDCGSVFQLCDYLMVNHQKGFNLVEKEIGSINGDLAKIANFYEHSPRWSRKTLLPVLSNFKLA